MFRIIQTFSTRQTQISISTVRCGSICTDASRNFVRLAPACPDGASTEAGGRRGTNHFACFHGAGRGASAGENGGMGPRPGAGAGGWRAPFADHWLPLGGAPGVLRMTVFLRITRKHHEHFVSGRNGCDFRAFREILHLI